MARRSILSATERENLIGGLNNELIIQFHTLSDADISIIKQRRGERNRLGFAIQLCYMRYPGIVLPEIPDELVFNMLQINSILQQNVLMVTAKEKTHFTNIQLNYKLFLVSSCFHR